MLLLRWAVGGCDGDDILAGRAAELAKKVLAARLRSRQR